MTARAGTASPMTERPSIDEELIERLRRIETDQQSTLGIPTCVNPDGPEAADRLESLLSDRAKLEELLTRVWACHMDAGEGRFVNLAKLRPVIAEIGDALNRSTDRG